MAICASGRKDLGYTHTHTHTHTCCVCVCCVLCMLPGFVFRVCFVYVCVYVCVCVNVRFTMSEKQWTGKRVEAGGGERKRGEGGEGGWVMFFVGPLGPVHGDRHGRQNRSAIQGSHLCKLRDMVFQAQVLFLLRRRLRGSLRGRCQRCQDKQTSKAGHGS